MWNGPVVKSVQVGFDLPWSYGIDDSSSREETYSA